MGLRDTHRSSAAQEKRRGAVETRTLARRATLATARCVVRIFEPRNNAERILGRVWGTIIPLSVGIPFQRHQELLREESLAVPLLAMPPLHAHGWTETTLPHETSERPYRNIRKVHTAPHRPPRALSSWCTA